MAKQEQHDLPGIPGPPKRKIIQAIEDKCIERDKLAGKRTALSEKIAEKTREIEQDIADHKLPMYTYEDAHGVLQDVYPATALKKRKSKSNPRKKKGGDE